MLSRIKNELITKKTDKEPYSLGLNKLIAILYETKTIKN